MNARILSDIRIVSLRLLVTATIALGILYAPNTMPPAHSVAAADAPLDPVAPDLTGAIGDYVWRDVSGNGLQGFTERGVNGVEVALLNTAGMVISTTTTASGGHYLFAGLPASTYVISFTPSTDYVFTEQIACGISCAAGDSDPDINTGATMPITLTAGESNLTIDAGLIQVASHAFVPNVYRNWFKPLVCDPSSTYWMAVISGNPGYTFCSKQDLEFVAGLPSVVRFGRGADMDLSLKWNVFGTGGVRLKIGPDSSQCVFGGSQGQRDVPVDGSNGLGDYIYPLNANEFGYGGFKIELLIVNQQGVTVEYNEKYLCVT